MFTFSSCNAKSLHEEELATATDKILENVSNTTDTSLAFTKHLTNLQ